MRKVLVRKVFALLLYLLVVVITEGGVTSRAFADVAIDAENFPDAVFRNYVSSYCDTNHDGILSDLEISTVTLINVSDSNIVSLNGIEYLTALTTLNCNRNQLTALDVSNNTVLTILYCHQNHQLTALDVSACSALTELDCYGNQLTVLDVSHNTALTTLDCSGNQLTTLDVSHNTALTTLNCSGNQLTALDLSHNTALTHLSCSWNQLTALDVSSNTALMWLSCYNNQLMVLDVSNNTALTYLQCFGNQLMALDVNGCSALTELDCYLNQLTALDVTNNTALTTLECDTQTLTLASADSTSDPSYPYSINLNTLRTSRGISATVPDFISRVHSLDIRDSSGSSVEHNTDSSTGIVYFAAMPASLSYNYDLNYSGGNSYMPVTVSFGSSSGSDSGSNTPSDGGSTSAINSTNFPHAKFRSYIAEKIDTDGDGYLSDSEALAVTSIDLYNYDSSSASEGTSLAGIKRFTALTYLDCRSQNLTSLDVSSNIALTYLNCSDNQLTELDVSHNTALTYLNCYSNHLSALDLGNNIALETLHCDSNDLTALDVSQNTALTELWCGVNSLTELDLSNNTALTQMFCGSSQLTSLDVSHNTALEYLDCSYNQIAELDLSNNTALRALYCGSNQLTALDVSLNTALTDLDCCDNQLTELDVSQNTELTYLCCRRNQLSALDVSLNTALEYLNCDFNQLTTLDVSKNTALTHLDCRCNQLTALDLSSNTLLRNLYCYSNDLTALDLSNNTDLRTLSCYENHLTALELSNNTALDYLNCGSQDLNIARLNSTSNPAYPYSLNLNTTKASLGLSVDIADFISRVKSLDITTSSGSTVNCYAEPSEGIAYFSALPSTIKYDYNTQASVSSSGMNVTVTIGSSSSGGNTSGGGSSGGSSDPYYVPPQPGGDSSSTVSEDLSPTSEDIVPISQDIPATVSDDQSTVIDDHSGGGDNIETYGWASATHLSTAQALLTMLARINSGSEPEGQYYVIDADIDLSDQNWTGIGTEAHPFTGHFDGGNYTITCPPSSGLFGLISSDNEAVINITVRISSTSTSGFMASASPSQCVGGIAQELFSGTIENCTFSGSLIASGEDSYAGGIVGELSGGTIRNCRVLAGSRISARYSAGGIAGYVSGGEITECSSSATLDAGYSGGIAGYSETVRDNINSNSFSEADFEVGNDAESLTLTPSSQNVQEGSAITAITFSLEGIRSWSFESDLAGLVSSDNVITGTIPYDTEAGTHTITINALTTDQTRVSGHAAVNVTRLSSRRNFMDYIFDVPEAVRDGIASFFGVDEIYQFTEQEIVSENWQPERSDLQDIANMNLHVVLNLPEVRPVRSGVYLLKLTLLELTEGAALGIQGISGSSQVSSSALEDVEYALFDENGREINGVPAGKVVYAALRLSSGRTHRSVVTAPKNLGLGTIQPFAPDDALMAKIADTANVSVDKLHVLGEENIGDPRDPTQKMLDEMAARDSNPVGKMNTLIVSRDGYYVFKVTLSDDLYEQHIQGVKADELKAYVLYDNGEAGNSEVSASFVTGLLNTWELLTLNGDKLEFGAKEFLMVGLLNAGTPFSVYLTKLLIALLMGGCDVGFGLAGLAAVCGAVILIMRRRL